MNVLFSWEELLTVLKTVTIRMEKCPDLSLQFGQFRFLIHKYFSRFTMETLTYHI